jgi:hypothetical protein
VHGLTVELDVAAERVDLERPDPQPARQRSPVSAPQDSCDPAPELRIAERLYEVVVTPALKAADPVELPGAAGQQDDGQVWVDPAGGPVRAAQLTQQVEPVAVREAQIDDRQIGTPDRHQPQTIGRRGGHQGLISVRQEVVREERPRRPVVLDNQDCGLL